MSWKRRIDQWKKYLTVRAPFSHSGPTSGARVSSSHGSQPLRGRDYVRRSLVESLEARNLFAVDPLWVGGVFIEEDMGSDLTPDRFFIQFKGGAENTKLTKSLSIRISCRMVGLAEICSSIRQQGGGVQTVITRFELYPMPNSRKPTLEPK